MIIQKSDWLSIRSSIESLFSDSFGRNIKSGYFDWRYMSNGKEDLYFSVETSESIIAASYSAFPVDIVLNECFYNTAMSMTTMTHPLMRGKGLFQQLATELYSYMRNREVAFVWGFPNQNSHPTFSTKLSWRDIYEIPTMKMDLSSIDSSALTISNKVNRDDSFSLIYTTKKNNQFIHVNKSADYLGWRYAKNPVNKYENYVIHSKGIVSSYVVTKRYGDGIDLVDIQCSNLNEAKVLLTHIAKLGLDCEVKHLSCWMSVHHELHVVLERLGFSNSAPVTYFGARDLLPELTPKGWENYANWYIQMGDSDVY